MEQKRVSFKVAEAIKEAGYPQNDLSVWYDSNGVIFTIHPKEGTEYYVAPEYLSVWLWLWKEKKINVTPIATTGIIEFWSRDGKIHFDPEEAIIASIEHLIENNLIK